MRQFLAKIPTDRLFLLAANYHMQSPSREKMIEELVDFYRSNGITIKTLKESYPDLAAFE